MPTLPPDRAIEARYLWWDRKVSHLARSRPALALFCSAVRRAAEADLIPEKHRRVLIGMSEMMGPLGCCPGMIALARRARCSVRTVLRALARAEVLGLVRRRRARVQTVVGSRVRVHRQTNAYDLMVPICLPDLLSRRAASSVKQGKGDERKGSCDNLAHSSTVGMPMRSIDTIIAARQAARDAIYRASRGWARPGE